MRSGTALQVRRAELWRLIEPWHQRFIAGQRLAAEHAEALAEAYFRIGVHPDTAPEQAVEVLGHAHRLDPANPRHPYHLGLLYLRRGQPDQAVDWLKAAAERSPVNHRVRAHLSLAFRDLDETLKDSPGHKGTERDAGAAIAVAVRDGVDEFDPAAYPEAETAAATVAQTEPGANGHGGAALLRPGECRWSGINDLQAEERLRGGTTERTRDALAGQLETVIELAGRRPGGSAAFTVLAVQWLVSGYPVATIRRLASRLPSGDGPSLRLLELVCELFEIDPAELPSRLAECLAERSLPDLLAALIHQRRLLWRPLRFPDLGAHAAAREFAGDQADRHVKALEAARRELRAARPAPMADVDIADAAAPTPAATDARLAAFEQDVHRIQGLRKNLTAQIAALGKQRIEDESDYARVAADRRLLEESVEALERVREMRLVGLQQSKKVEPAGLAMEFAEFQERLGECESQLQDSFRKLLRQLTKRVDPRLDQARSAYGAVEPAPSQEAVELARRVAALDPSRQSTTTGDDRAAPAPPPVPATASEQVAQALADAEQALDDNFAEAWQTLESYPRALWHRDALVLLRGYLGGKQAEAEYRLGRSISARRRWTALVADDPLHLGLLKNLAVAHTSAGDPPEAAEAWGRYVEAIYLRDLLLQDVRRGAGGRASLHRVFAASFGTAPLCSMLIPDDHKAETDQQIPLLLSSRAKVALATEHLRLEEINHIVSHRSPTLLLGIDRTDGDGAPAARERRANALQAAAAILPARVRAPFEKECLRLLDLACAEVSEAKGRVRRPGDQAEEDAHTQWAEGRVEWKFAILKAVTTDADWPLTEYAGAVIANLRLVDELPLDSTDAMLRDCVQKAVPGQDPADVIWALDHLSERAAKFALECLHDLAKATPDSDADALRAADRFRRIGRSWARNSVPDQWLERLDDPVELYGEAVAPALQILQDSDSPTDDREREIVTSALPVLRTWVARLPGATGPARTLARLTGALGDHDEALKILLQAQADAFSAVGLVKVRRARALLDIVRGEFEAAVAAIQYQLAGHPDDEQFRALLMRAFDRWTKSEQRGPDPEAIIEAFAPWTDEETVQTRRILALNAALARYSASAAATGLDQLLGCLNAMIHADPDHLDAHYQLAVALHRKAYECRVQMRRCAGAARQERQNAMIAALSECEERSRELLPLLEGEEYTKQRQELEKIVEEVSDALR